MRLPMQVYKFFWIDATVICTLWVLYTSLEIASKSQHGVGNHQAMDTFLDLNVKYRTGHNARYGNNAPMKAMGAGGSTI